MIWRTILILAIALPLSGAAGKSALADGGAVRIVERQSNYQISVFTSPNPLAAGNVDISVLVQDATTLQPVDEATVEVTVTPRAEPWQAARQAATTAAATNKLFRAAQFDAVPAGWLDVEVNCELPGGQIRTAFAMEAGTPLAGGWAQWPWFSWPLVVVLAFVTHRWLARH